MKQHTYVVIMAGGIGSRFWPYSRNQHPKQFIDILGTGKSLLRMTYERFLPLCPSENVYVVTNDDYAGQVREHLPELSDDQILLEPVRRNTAPCIAYATYKIAERDPQAVTIVTPSDHYVGREDRFQASLTQGVEVAREHSILITLGIQPSRPETGYGYIQYLEQTLDGVNKVKTFTEKPELELAQKFLDSGDFVWNSGIFIWSVASAQAAFEAHLPEMHEIFAEGTGKYATPDEALFVKEAYSLSKSISIDYGVMEKAENVYVVLADFDWSDLGSWSSLYEKREPKDEAANVVDGNVLLYDTKDSLVKGPKQKLLVVQGLEGYLVADEGDVLLICKLDEEGHFRRFVTDVKDQKGKKFL